MIQPTPGRQHARKPQWDVVCDDKNGHPIVLRTWVGLTRSLPEVMFRVTEAGTYVVLHREAGAQLIVNINNAFDALARVGEGRRGLNSPRWLAHCRRPDDSYVDVKTQLVRGAHGPGVGVQVDREDAVAVLSYECGSRLLVALKTAFRVAEALVDRGSQS